MTEPPATPEERERHWDERYFTVGSTNVSWYQPSPDLSLAIVDHLGIDASASVIDVGGGASTLVDALVGRGCGDVTVLDVSATALAEAQARLGERPGVHWIHADLLAWQPDRTWDLWHDRAVFHFLTEEADRAAYCERAARALTPGGLAIVATFASDGPTHCSGLPVARYDVDGLVAALGGWDLVASGRSVHTTPTGGAQPFTWVAVRR